MSEALSKRVEVAANISIILAVALGAFIVVRDRVLAKRQQPEVRETSAKAGNRETLAGTTVSLPGVDWASNGQTLLIVLAKGCRFCTESAPFYKQIAEAAVQRRDFHVVAVLPQAESEARDYLKKIEVPINEVRQIPINEIGVRGTPTLLLVDKTGVVKDAWLGRLQPEKEAEVLREVACKDCSWLNRN